MKKRIKSIFKRSTAAALSAAMVFSLGVSSVPAIVLAQDSETGTELQNDSQEVKIELGEISSMSAKSYGPATDGDTLEASFDGDTTTYTNSNYNDAANSKPQVYTFNFAEEVNLCKVRIHPRNTGGHVGNGAPNSCIVEVSTDGNSYTQVASQAVNDTALVWTDITFAATPAKSVRLTLDSAHATVVTTGEVELYKEVTQAAGADKTELQALYDEVKDAEFTYPDKSYYEKFTTALAAAAEILASEDADQDAVDSAHDSLERYYWLNMVNDKVAYYNIDRQGEDGRFGYDDRPTESILPVVAAFLEGHNSSAGWTAERLINCYNRFVEAEKLIQEPAPGIQGVQTGLVIDAADADNPGYFEITNEEVVNDNGETQIKVSFKFVNDGIDSVTGEDIGEYSSYNMRNASFRVRYTRPTGGSVTKFVSEDTIEALDGNWSKGITGEFSVDPESTVSLEMYYRSDDTFMPGYYKVISAVPAVDKTALQNLYDEASAAEFTYEDSTLKTKLTNALTDAKTVLDDADATQEDVDSAYYYLEKHYWQNKVYDKKEYYNPEKAGADGRFVYSDKVTESILPLAAAYQETRNVNGNTEIDKLREYYDILTAADAAQADVITAEPDQRSTEIGFNTQDDSYINYALDPQNYGHFNITGQEFVLDDNGEVSVKVTFEFVNDGKHPVTGAEGSKYSSSEMRNPGCRVVYGDGTTQKGSKGVSNIAALNGNYSNGITGEFTVSQDSVISLYLKDSVMAGYFKVQKFTPADKTALKEKTDEAAAIIEEEYKYNHNDKWEAFLESYEAAQDVYDNPIATDTEVNNAREDLTNKIFELRFETEKPEAVFVINGEEKEITADALLNSEFDLKFTDNGKLTQFVLNGTESALDGTEDTAAFAEIEALLNEGNGEDGKNTLIVRDSVVTDGIYWNENTYTFYFDQTAPVLGEPEYIENEDGSVTVKIDVDELDQNRLPEGWTYEDGAVIKNFTESAEEEVVLYDAAGNASSAAVKVAITEDPENPEDPDPEDPQKPGTGDADKPSTGKPSDTQKPDGNSGNAQKAVVTGDESSPVLWIVVLAAACVVAGVIVVIKKKK